MMKLRRQHDGLDDLYEEDMELVEVYRGREINKIREGKSPLMEMGRLWRRKYCEAVQ